MVPALGDLGRGKCEAGPDLFLTKGVRLAEVLRSLASGQGPKNHSHWHTGVPNDRLSAPHGRSIEMWSSQRMPRTPSDCTSSDGGVAPALKTLAAYRRDAQPLLQIVREAPPFLAWTWQHAPYGS